MVVLASAQSFKGHRADGFKVLPQDTSDIVFIGNSITNLHNWSEAFGDVKIQNRGISAITIPELLPNLPYYLTGQPKKIFIMIGTNDLGQNGGNVSAQVVAERMKDVVSTTVGLCPNSEVYIQSIVPSLYGGRTLATINTANQLIKTYVESLGNPKLTFIDLTSLLAKVANNEDGYSYDQLHLTSKAYSAWCHEIAKYVGHETTYAPAEEISPDYGTLSNPGGTGAAPRTTVFGALPVKDDDILFLGNEMVHSGEWWELLGNLHVKNRGWGWWTPGTTLDELIAQLRPIFHDNAQPSKVFIYCGNDANNTIGNVNTTLTKYKALVDSIRTRCPHTGIYAVSLLPNNNGGPNPKTFNDALKAWAATQDSVTFVDIYSAVVGNDGKTANSTYINSNWVTGLGYAKIAEVLAQYIPCCTPLTEAKAKANLATKEEVVKAFNEAQNAQLRPKASDSDSTYWYTFCSTLRGNRYTVEGSDGKLFGSSTFADSLAAHWKFLTRTDGDLDIVNRKTGHYIAPTAAYNTQITTSDAQPSTGWQVKDAATLKMFILSSGTVELNQTNLNGLPVYNWSTGNTGNDTSDTGCQLTIARTYVGTTAEPTGISLLSQGGRTVGEGSGASYNLAGQRVSNAYKGIVIQCGKKHIAR